MQARYSNQDGAVEMMTGVQIQDILWRQRPQNLDLGYERKWGSRAAPRFWAWVTPRMMCPWLNEIDWRWASLGMGEIGTAQLHKACGVHAGRDVEEAIRCKKWRAGRELWVIDICLSWAYSSCFMSDIVRTTEKVHSWNKGLEKEPVLRWGTSSPEAYMTDKVHISPQGVESVLLKARKRTSNVDQRKNFRRSHGLYYLPTSQKSLVIISFRSECLKNVKNWRQVRI